MKLIQSIILLGFLSEIISAVMTSNTCGGRLADDGVNTLAVTKAAVKCKATPSDFLNGGDGEHTDCFDEKLKVDSCRDIQVDILYKLCDKDDLLDFVLDTNPKNTFFKFNNVDIGKELGVSAVNITGGACHTYKYTTQIYTCDAYSVDMRMKLKPEPKVPGYTGSRCNADGLIKFVLDANNNDERPPAEKDPKTTTKAPKASKSPKASKDPTNTKSPKTSKSPKASKSPKVSTKSPKGSRSPKVIKKKKTKAPKSKRTKAPSP